VAFIVREKYGYEFVILFKEKVVTYYVFPRGMVKGVGEPGELVFKTDGSIIERYAEIEASYFYVPYHPTTIVSVQVVNSYEVGVPVDSIGGYTFGELSEKTFFLKKKETVVLGCGSAVGLLRFYIQ
jgi:hypothetical protein